MASRTSRNNHKTLQTLLAAFLVGCVVAGVGLSIRGVFDAPTPQEAGGAPSTSDPFGNETPDVVEDPAAPEPVEISPDVISPAPDGTTDAPSGPADTDLGVTDPDAATTPIDDQELHAEAVDPASAPPTPFQAPQGATLVDAGTDGTQDVWFYEMSESTPRDDILYWYVAQFTGEWALVDVLEVGEAPADKVTTALAGHRDGRRAVMTIYPPEPGVVWFEVAVTRGP